MDSQNMVRMTRKEGYEAFDYGAFDVILTSYENRNAKSICDQCGKRKACAIFRNKTYMNILLKICDECFCIGFEAKSANCDSYMSIAKMEFRMREINRMPIMPVVIAMLLTGALGYSDLEYQRDVAKMWWDGIWWLIGLFMVYTLFVVLIIPLSGIFSAIQKIVLKVDTKIDSFAEACAEIKDGVAHDYRQNKNFLYREYTAFKPLAMRFGNAAVEEFISAKMMIRDEYRRARNMKTWQMVIQSGVGIAGTLLSAGVMYYSTRGASSNVHVFKQEAKFKKGYGFSKLITSTFAFLGVICSLLGITAGIDFFREKYESSRKIPDVLNLFRYFKRKWKGKKCEFKVNADIFTKAEDAEIFMTALKDHKVSVPDIDSGAKEGEEAFFFKPEKDENYDYEVQMFNRYIGKNGMVDQPIGTMWMYRGSMLSNLQRQLNMKQFLMPKENVHKFDWLKDVDFVIGNTVMFVYLDIDETRARNNYKTFDEAVKSLREKCFGKEKEQKPIIKKDEAEEREIPEFNKKVAETPDEELEMPPMKKPKWWTKDHGIKADIHYRVWAQGNLSQNIRYNTARLGAAKQNDVARVFIDHVNDDKSVDKKEVCRDLFYWRYFQYYCCLCLAKAWYLPFGQTIQRPLIFGKDIVKPPLIETDDMPRFLDVDALTVHHNHWKCCSKGCAKEVMIAMKIYNGDAETSATMCFCRVHMYSPFAGAANAWYAVVMEWDPEFSKEDTFGDSEEESDQVVSDSEMAEEIAKMYEIDESPLHVKEKEVEPVKKEELSLEVEPVQKEEPIIEAVVVEDKVKPESLGDVVAEFLREDPWDAVKKRFQKVGNDLWAYIENVDAADVVVWATMLVVSGIASYGVGRVCEKVFEPKRKEKEFFVDEANRAKKRFWLIYGDGEGKYKQYDRVTLLGDDSRTEMSWGDFKRFANTPRGRQQLFDHFADAEGNVRFSVKGRGDGKLKMRNKNFRFEAKHDVENAKQMKEKIKKKERKVLDKNEPILPIPHYDFSKINFPHEVFASKQALRDKKKQERKTSTEKIIKMMEQIDSVIEKNVCMRCKTTHKGKCQREAAKNGEVVLLQNKEGEQIHPLCALDAIYKEESILGNAQMVNADDVNNRLGKLLIDGEFVMNCWLHGDKVVALGHGVHKSDVLVPKEKILFVFPDETLKPIKDFEVSTFNDDFGHFKVQPSKKKERIPLRKPKNGEKVALIAYQSMKERTPSVSFGVMATTGEHTCSSVAGCCAGVLMSVEDKNVLGWHNGGGTYVNRAWAVDNDVLKHLK